MPKKKYSTELKLQIVQEYLNGNVGKEQIAEKYYVTASDVQKWSDAYREHGASGLCTTHGTYTGYFKQTVVEYMHNTSSSARQTAAHFNIPGYTTVCKWERIYLEEGKDALYKERRGRAGNMNNTKKECKPKTKKQVDEDLIAEVQRLRMENEYLKKLNALIQEREKSKNQTR